MKGVIYSARGEELRELKEVSYGEVEYAHGHGSTTVTLSRQSSDYADEPEFWRGQEMSGRMLLLEQDNGLPDWVGVVTHVNEREGEGLLRVRVAGPEQAMQRTVIRRRLRFAGSPTDTFRRVLNGGVRRDGYPIAVDPDSEDTDTDLSGPLMPQSLYRLLEGFRKDNGHEWTVSPRVTASGLLRLEVTIRRHIGSRYPGRARINSGVDILADGLERESDGTHRINHVVAVGKASQGGKVPIVEAQLERDVDEHGPMSTVIHRPEIHDEGRLLKAAQAALRELSHVFVNLAVRITNGNREDVYGELGVGDDLEVDVEGWGLTQTRVMGYSYAPEPEGDEGLTLVLRNRHSMPEEGVQIDE